jgi:D-amino peptidase
MVQGIDSGDIDGVLFVGYHARSGSANGILAHTWSNKKIANVWLNGIVMGEYGINAALCGHYDVPVLMITGDQTTCAQAVDLLGELETVVVKHATGFSSAECVPLKTAQDMIHDATLRALKSLANGTAPAPFIVSKPIETKIEFRLVEMADRACLIPGTCREDGTTISKTLPDMVDAYRYFRAAVSLG